MNEKSGIHGIENEFARFLHEVEGFLLILIMNRIYLFLKKL